jgi:hypothetical protein
VTIAEEGEIAPVESSLGSLEAVRSGRRVSLRLTMGRETLEIVGPEGRTELSIVLTERGPKLVIETADVEIRTVNHVVVDCESLEVKARGALTLEGGTTSIVAARGDVDLKANDAIKLVGEQIRLNCDGPEKVPPWMEKELEAQLVRALRDKASPGRDE